MRKFFKVHLTLVLFILTAALLQAASASLLPVSESSVSLDAESLPTGVSIHRLDNGIQVLLIENPGLPMVGVNVVVKVGSAYETFASSGMSHMLEHLLFNGTTTRTQKQLYDDVDRIGGYNNANTSDFYTNFMMVVPSENIREGMKIQADMLFHSTLPPKKFIKEKGIVLEEISKTLADPEEQAERSIRALLYQGHGYSLPTLGTYSTIEAMDRDQVFEFYKNNYVPNNMLMSVIGNFHSKQMLKMIEDIYGTEAPGSVLHEDLPDWSLGLSALHLKAPRPGSAFHRFYDGKAIRLQLFYRLSGKFSTEFFDLLDIKLDEKREKLNSTLKKQFSEILKNLQLSSRPSPFDNYIEADLTVKESKNYNKLINAVSQALASCDFHFNSDELQAQSGKARTAFLKNIEKPHMFGIFNAEIFAVRGIEAVLASYGRAGYYKAAQQLKNLHFSSLPIVIMEHPSAEKESVQNSAATLKLFAENANAPALIVKQNPASHLLAIHYLLKHKAPLEARYGKEAAKILHDCFGQRLKTPANQKKSSRFGLSVKVNDNPYFPMDDIYMNPDFAYIRVEGLAEYLSDVIRFLNSQMLNFKPTKAEFLKAQKKFSHKNPMAMMMGRGDPAKKIFKKTYKKLIYQASPFQNAPKLTYENLLAFARSYFRPDNMIISVVSPAPPKKIAALFKGFNARQARPEAAVYIKSLKLHQKPVTVDKKGGGRRSYLFYGFTEPIDPKDKPSLRALSLILGDKIIFDIREKQGLAYNLNAGIEMLGDKALFYIKQGTRPKNVDVLLPQYAGFLNPKMLNGVTPADLEKSVNMYLGRMMFRRLSSINQGYYLGYSLYFHKDIRYDRQFLDHLKKVRLNDVQRVAQKYLHIKNPVEVIIR